MPYMFRWNRNHGRRDRDEVITPEEVLLQVSLAFTIILGFLLSDESALTIAIGRRLRRAEAVYGELLGSSKDDLVRETDRAIGLADRMRLLNAWLKVRDVHPLFLRVQEFGGPGGLMRHMSPRDLLSNADFMDMRDAIDVFFGGTASSDEPADELADEIARCVVASVAEAGFGMPDWTDEAPLWLRRAQSRQALELLDGHGRAREGVALSENLQFLAEEIQADFVALRGRAARVQLRAVVSISTARMAREITPGVSSDVERALAGLLDELDAHLKLLPEVRQQLESAR